ncbi:hypothetical protein BGZ80_000887 [Entomortierella chlamydospora]|uniref:Epoxide hydrolase n=1 Tax=Entomortierella chlamydospora TaxID=101097 RepID=A0A9P6MRL4_9FUNG|nr:hypothetical protein BGZ79_007872 [Entomortierella chlamydospora]KAG0011159.1 hypothetical protein BGZ80_000887 [Entomortierella chlamydospora]
MATSNKSSTQEKSFKAVFFDMGGVVVGSPFSGIAEYERDYGLPVNYLNVAISRSGSNGAFQKLERNEIDLWAFYDAFSEQLSDPLNVAAYAQYAQLRNKVFDEKSFKAPKVNGRELFHRMMGKAAVVVPSMVHAIAKLREAGYIVAALTNNFHYPTDEKGLREQDLILATAGTLNQSQSSSPKSGSLVMGQEEIKSLFNHYIESAILGLRKPDPAIYRKSCEIVGVQPSEVVFLDDIGENLKSAQNVGFTTIRVELGKPEKAIQQLETILGRGIKLLPSEAKL